MKRKVIRRKLINKFTVYSPLTIDDLYDFPVNNEGIITYLFLFSPEITSFVIVLI